MEGGGQVVNMEGLYEGMRSMPLKFARWVWLSVLMGK